MWSTPFKDPTSACCWRSIQFVPVLKDPNLAASTNLDFYADTGLHLTGAGSAERTDQLGAAIKNWDTWTPEALRARDAELAQPATL